MGITPGRLTDKSRQSSRRTGPLTFYRTSKHVKIPNLRSVGKHNVNNRPP